jgi:hypothetical protein
MENKFYFEVTDKELRIVEKELKKIGAKFWTNTLFDGMIMVTVECNNLQKFRIEELGYTLEEECIIDLIG